MNHHSKGVVFGVQLTGRHDSDVSRVPNTDDLDHLHSAASADRLQIHPTKQHDGADNVVAVIITSQLTNMATTIAAATTPNITLNNAVQTKRLFLSAERTYDVDKGQGGVGFLLGSIVSVQKIHAEITDAVAQFQAVNVLLILSVVHHMYYSFLFRHAHIGVVKIKIRKESNHAPFC